MSILSRYTVKEILSHLAGVMFIVVAVFMVRHFAEFLGDAAEGDLPSGVLLRLLGLRTVMALPSLLPAGLYIATLFVVWQVVNYFAFHTTPGIPILAGGALIIVGGLIVTFWKS